MNTRSILLVLGLLFAVVLVAVFFLGGESVHPGSRARSRLEPKGGAPAGKELSAVSANPATGGYDRAGVEVPASGTTTSELRVHVIAAETHQPLSGVRLTLLPAVYDPDRPRAVAVDDSRGSLERAPRTDEDGYAAFSVPEGVEQTVS